MAEAYQIRDWEKHFEVSQMRRCRRASWVAIPNKHDGKSYKRLMRIDPNHYLAWVLIVQVASKMPLRGLLADSDGALSAEDLEIKTECPAAIFAKALPVLASEKIGWLTRTTLGARSERSRSTLYLQTGQTGQTGQDRHNKTNRTNKEKASSLFEADADFVWLPEKLEPARVEIETWLQHKRERKQSYKPTGLKQLLNKLLKWDMAELRAAINHSIANNYAGIHSPRGNDNGHRPEGNPGRVRQRDWKAVDKARGTSMLPDA